MRKILLVHAIHLREVGHVVEEHVALDDALNPHARLLEYGNNVLAALRRLVGDAALGKRAGGVGGDLARDEDLGASDYGLGLGNVSVSCCSLEKLG
jgi:hypothetical protein